MIETTPSRRQAGVSPAPRIIATTLHVYQWLLLICPLEFRREYGAQMLQVARASCRAAYKQRGAQGVMRLWFSMLGDVITGASAEYLSTIERSLRMNRLRAAAITVFCAYIAFVVAGLGFQKMTEGVDKAGVMQTYPTIGGSFYLIEAGSVVSLLAVLAGGLPMAFAALRQALAAKRWGVVALLFVPVPCFAILVAYVVLVKTDTLPKSDLAIQLVTLFIALAIISTASVAIAIARSNLSAQVIGFVRWPAIITALAMAVMCVATVVWGVSLRADAPQWFSLDGGGDLYSYRIFTWLRVVIIMAIATLIAIIAAVRGFSTRTPSTQAP